MASGRVHGHGLAARLDRAMWALAFVAGLIATVMMAVTVLDVAGRFLANRPLTGAFEAIELMMAAIVFLALPAVTWRREHVVVTVLYERMPPFLQSLSTAAGEIASALTCGILSWRAWLYGERLFGSGERTLELGVPRGAIPAGASIILGLLVALFLIRAMRALFLGERAPS
ncbi:TRAP transporter small permease [Arenibaculum pallidiluteum]|uniref:TRAP transporter small permease n=1 Tax=Arenibaculum pallidiluteum TaxID=2812559 RepID=UPI001A975CB0|nr:TRAP transporter small permease [Arenibaculum pallidiluteum]